MKCSTHFFLVLCIVLISIVSFAGPSRDEKPRKLPPTAKVTIDFEKHIQPLFEDRCNSCHGQEAQEGLLRLDAKKVVMKGGISGRLFDVGKSGQSLLVKRLLGHGDGDAMPLDDEPLTDKQIGLVRAWIDQGAKWPDGVGAKTDAVDRHWAYQPPIRPALPASSLSPWGNNPIDRFTYSRMKVNGLSPSPMASKAARLRRVYLDLIGLPPTVEELDAFLSDERPDAYARVVKALLASERFGEKWARSWLDLARYADSNGYQADQYREVWPYRDWVINALNSSMPFDQFTIEQLAGDLLPNATQEQRVATGFHRMTTCNVEAGVDPEENRVNQIIDRVNTTGTVWLGTTLECAQCHNHKYDPFNMEDYYGIFAFFNNTPLEVKHTTATTYDFFGPKMPLQLSDEQLASRDRIQFELGELNSQLDTLINQKLIGFKAWEKAQLEKTPKAYRKTEEPGSWHVAKITSFKSLNGATHRVLDDQSVLAGGPKPNTDTYEIIVSSNVDEIRGIKLETLTHESLPGKGPGRHHPERPNFVLQDFTVHKIPSRESQLPDSRTKVPLMNAQADFSQSRYNVVGAIDNDSNSGWAINGQFHRDHYATFAPQAPITISKGDILKLRFVQNHGAGRTIGRLRISFSKSIPPKITPAQVGSAKMPPVIAEILNLDANKRSQKQSTQLREYFLATFNDVQAIKNRKEDLKKNLKSISPPTTLVMVEMDGQRTTRLFKRGEFLNPGREVPPSTPKILHGLPNTTSQSRLDLAKWIVSEKNPLTARVTVNRWWAEIFGHGLVRTTEDFGTEGDRPTHPQLLDWLAVEFMDSGWDMKHVLELIVNSSTYQQQSRLTDLHRRVDPENLWISRAPRVRMPAEMIRDNGLRICGTLSTKMGGPPIFPPQPEGVWRHVGRNAPKYVAAKDENRYRRGIYVIWRRSAPYASFVNFDAPDRAACVVKRPRTNTPLQALTLLNDDAFLEMAWALAAKTLLEFDDDESRVRYAFRSCVSRFPSEKEEKFLLNLLQDKIAQYANNPNTTRLLAGRREVPTGVTSHEYAAWFTVANILLNLDETITKN